jgi:hypothetical protein
VYFSGKYLSNFYKYLENINEICLISPHGLRAGICNNAACDGDNLAQHSMDAQSVSSDIHRLLWFAGQGAPQGRILLSRHDTVASFVSVRHLAGARMD